MISTFLSFFSSDIGVSIAWFASVGGFLYGLQQRSERIKVQKNYQKLENNMKSRRNEYKADGLNQQGEKNVYTQHNSGQMNIDM